jgi:hypothetical protein
MDVIYTFNCFVIVILAIILQNFFNMLLNNAVEMFVYQTEWNEVSVKLSSTLSVSEIETLNAELLVIEEVLLPFISQIMKKYRRFLIFNMFFSLYFVQNIFQMIFTKLTNKKVRIFTIEHMVNGTSLTISVYIMLRYFLFYAHIEASEEKYEEMEQYNAIFNDKVIKGVVSLAVVV